MRRYWTHALIVGMACTPSAWACTGVRGQSQPVTEFPDGPLDPGNVHTNEMYRLTIPAAQVHDVWKYLQTAYVGDAALLPLEEGRITVRFTEDFLIDRYYDDDNLVLLNRRSCVRQRTQKVTHRGIPTGQERQLVQIVFPQQRELPFVCSRITFPVTANRVSGDLAASHPLLKMIATQDQEAFREAVRANLRMQPGLLRSTLTATQYRRCVHVQLDQMPVATVALVEVHARLWWQHVSFFEVQITPDSSKDSRLIDAQLQSRLERAHYAVKAHLLATFARVSEDPTPQYNRLFDQFNEKYVCFPLALRTGIPCEGILGGLSFILVANVGSTVVRRVRFRCQRQEFPHAIRNSQ